MKKINFLFLFILLLLFLFSCWDEDDISVETEKIEVINQAKEDVKIYHYNSSNMEMMNVIIRRDETRFIWVKLGRKYYARGESSKKEYGERVFKKVPSNYDVHQTWLFIDE